MQYRKKHRISQICLLLDRLLIYGNGAWKVAEMKKAYNIFLLIILFLITLSLIGCAATTQSGEVYESALLPQMGYAATAQSGEGEVYESALLPQDNNLEFSVISSTLYMTFGLDTNGTLWMIEADYSEFFNYEIIAQFFDEVIYDAVMPIKIMDNVRSFHVGSHRGPLKMYIGYSSPPPPTNTNIMDFRLFIITNDNNLWAMGHNRMGMLGARAMGMQDTRTFEALETPTLIKPDVSHIYPFRDKVLVMTQSGTLYGWDRRRYVQVMENVASLQISDSNTGRHIFAISKCGALYSLNSYISGNASFTFYQIGREIVFTRSYISNDPTRILDDVASVYFPKSSLPTYVFALTTQGALYTWGRVFEPLPYPDPSAVPVRVMENVIYVHVTTRPGAMVITADGYLWRNVGYIDGMLTPERVLASTRSVHCPELSIVNRNRDYFRHFAITTNGDLYAWGNNDGMIGDGTLLYRPNPVRIMGDVKSVHPTYSWTFAVTTSGNLYGWGVCWSAFNWGRPCSYRCLKRSHYEPVKLMSNIHTVRYWRRLPIALGYDGSFWAKRRNGWEEVGIIGTSEKCLFLSDILREYITQPL